MLPGFGLRIAAGGRKTWIVLYRVGSKKVRESLGTLAAIPNVADARSKARESMRQAQAGVHPVAARRKQEAAEARALSAGAALDRYLAEYVERNTRASTGKETRRLLERDVKPGWGTRPLVEISRQDVNDLVDEIANRGAPFQSNRTLAQLKTFFSWARSLDLIATDPSEGVRRRAKEVARDRVLQDDEIRLFWSACERIGWPFGPLFKLLLVTAQRHGEVRNLEWPELDLSGRVWTIPREKAKNDRTQLVHLSPLAVRILEDLPQLEVPHDEEGRPRTRSQFIFTTTGLKPVSGMSRAKAGLDRRMLELLRKQRKEQGSDPEAAVIPDWILHDLRRTAATGMARLNAAPHVVEKILNHSSGTISGVAAIYNRHAYLEERKMALDGWGEYVQQLLRSA